MINIISSEKCKGNSFVAKYDFNTTIIGGGVIGLSIAYSLSKKIENILSTFSTYGVEVPNKRIKRIISENSKSITWLDMN